MKAKWVRKLPETVTEDHLKEAAQELEHAQQRVLDEALEAVSYSDDHAMRVIRGAVSEWKLAGEYLVQLQRRLASQQAA
jgi:hypothetical protein